MLNKNQPKILNLVFFCKGFKNTRNQIPFLSFSLNAISKDQKKYRIQQNQLLISKKLKKRLLFFFFKKKKQKKFNPLRNKRYCTILAGLYGLTKSKNYVLKKQDFLFLKDYYKQFKQAKTRYLRYFYISMQCPRTIKTSIERHYWYRIQRYKITLIKCFHRIFSKWYRKWYNDRCLFRSKKYKQRLILLLYLIYIKKKPKTMNNFNNVKKRKKFLKKIFIHKKRNKQFRLFSKTYTNKYYRKYKYQLKLLQKQFFLYFNTTKYFLKKINIFYKKYLQLSTYEKFFICIRHTLGILLTKLRYFFQFYTDNAAIKRLLLAGGIRVNGKIIKNFFFSVWLFDFLEINYRYYFLEWVFFYFLKLFKLRNWNAQTKKPYKYIKPYMKRNYGIFANLLKNWCISSIKFPGTILTKLLPKFWIYKTLPRFYTFLNLQIISELFVLRVQK